VEVFLNSQPRFQFSFSKWIQSLFFLGILGINFSSSAALFTGQSAELPNRGIDRVGLLPQISFSDSQLNLNGFYETLLSDDRSFRLTTGFGKPDFFLGFDYKFVPYPDYKDQPAIGGVLNMTISREGSDNYITILGKPLVSKKINIDQGLLIPYVSLPVGLTVGKGTSTYPISLVVGTEMHPHEFQNMYFSAEITMNVQNSSNAIAAAVIFPFDPEQGFNLKKRGDLSR
jgi:hypothetical protein